MDEALLDFLEISHYAGKHPEFVQGGGGNCSVKFSSKMLIKASGFFLSDVNEKEGYVYLDLKTKELLPDQRYKPSLETYIHFLLGKHVIHTHPILVGGLVCAKEGISELKNIFSDKNIYWIGYANPGRSLFSKIENFFRGENIPPGEHVAFFLKNHGVFISASTKEECISIHDFVINRLSDFFNYKNHTQLSKSVSLSGYLTPDHVVYATLPKNHLSPRQKIALVELEEFSKQVVALINSKNWHVDYLEEKDVSIVKNMEEEKYRQSFLR